MLAVRARLCAIERKKRMKSLLSAGNDARSTYLNGNYIRSAIYLGKQCLLRALPHTSLTPFCNFPLTLGKSGASSGQVLPLDSEALIYYALWSGTY